ncbi:hypothetical protein [Bdellovibrio sp. HCB337]|uniref:hypothetical protein n=1 Tax=Bdellovibrio sp. HCB337 TaxID=3394358 RepID=UPI0039A6D3E4
MMTRIVVLIAFFALFQVSCAGHKVTTPTNIPASEENNGAETPAEETPEVPDNPAVTPTPAPTPAATPTPLPTPASNELLDIFHQWKTHYKVSEPYTKVTDNNGKGFEDLYGTRNFRAVLHGVYYRGGANNKYHRDNPRDNMNPLPSDGLKNLCEEGFSTAIYYYATNYSGAPKATNCGSGSDKHSLNYKQVTALTSANHKTILQLIHDRIKGKLPGPIYGHCWNGWHASGLIAAISLRQFCDWTPTEARNYWRKNTDGNTSGYEKVEAMVVDFKPISSLKISAAEQAVICPSK